MNEKRTNIPTISFDSEPVNIAIGALCRVGKRWNRHTYQASYDVLVALIIGTCARGIAMIVRAINVKGPFRNCNGVPDSSRSWYSRVVLRFMTLNRTISSQPNAV